MSYVISCFKYRQSNGYETDLNYLFDQAYKYKNNKLKNNYNNFNEDYIASSIIYNPKPIGFSLLQERECFNGMGRVFTRLYFPAKLNGSLSVSNYKYSDGLRPELFEMLNQQIELGSKLGIKDFFMSRGDTKPLIMKNICNGLNKNGYDWKVDTEKKYIVVNNVSQWICFTGENRLASA